MSRIASIVVRVSENNSTSEAHLSTITRWNVGSRKLEVVREKRRTNSHLESFSHGAEFWQEPPRRRALSVTSLTQLQHDQLSFLLFFWGARRGTLGQCKSSAMTLLMDRAEVKSPKLYFRIKFEKPCLVPGISTVFAMEQQHTIQEYINVYRLNVFLTYLGVVVSCRCNDV